MERGLAEVLAERSRKDTPDAYVAPGSIARLPCLRKCGRMSPSLNVRERNLKLRRDARAAPAGRDARKLPPAPHATCRWCGARKGTSHLFPLATNEGVLGHVLRQVNAGAQTCVFCRSAALPVFPPEKPQASENTRFAVPAERKSRRVSEKRDSALPRYPALPVFPPEKPQTSESARFAVPAERKSRTVSEKRDSALPRFSDGSYRKPDSPQWGRGANVDDPPDRARADLRLSRRCPSRGRCVLLILQAVLRGRC
jgi:hypothetical protein